ncbi:MAG: ABC transporter substrate-binding protein [Propionibacteriaceae bacterium]|nr:ABC transporter substrate-binding protein [Propionibacteriaceae bacterium]
MPHRRWIAFVLAAAALSGCTPAPPPAPNPPASPSPAAGPVAVQPVAGIKQTPRERLRQGGRLRIGLTEWTADWNPWSADLPAHVAAALAATRPRLFDTSATGEFQPNPDWLDGAPAVEHDPVTRVVYRLNPQAVWGDGQPVTAADFRAAWQGCADQAADRPCASGRGFDAVAAVDEGETPREVVVTYTRPYPQWPLTFRDGPVRADAASGDPFAPWDNPAEHRDSQAGPYAAVAMTADAAELTLTANPRWWGRPAALISITLAHVPAGALAGSVAVSEFDAWPLGADSAAYTAATLNAALELRRAPCAAWRVLLLDRTAPAFADRRVRQAVVAALDRSRVALATLPGLAWTPETPNSLAWQPGQLDYDDLAAATGQPGFPADAARLLDEAEWLLDGQRRRQDGQTLTLRYAVAAGDPAGEAEALQIRAQLAAVGVGVELVDVNRVEARPLAEQGVDLATVTWRNDLQPAQRLQTEFGSTSPANRTGYANPTVDSLLATAATAVDPRVSADLTAAAETTVWLDAVVVPLYTEPDTWAVAPGVVNLGPSGLATLRWEDVGFAN